MDYKALSDALAARYAPGVVTPPTGYANIVASTAQPPNAIPRSPYVIVWPNKGALIVAPDMVYGRPQEFLVNFYYAKHEADLPREEAALQSWLGVLLGQTFPAMTLNWTGAGTVLKAIPVSWEIGALDYAGIIYDGITITVHIFTEEIVTMAA